jgi:hypothetical protein
MPMDAATLGAVAEAFTEGMTSIRGRRVQRLVRRELAAFDSVRSVKAEDGTPGLLARKRDGTLAFTHTTGRGPSADLVVSSGPNGPTVTTSYDLLKDSLPVVRTSRSQQDLLASWRR